MTDWQKIAGPLMLAALFLVLAAMCSPRGHTQEAWIKNTLKQQYQWEREMGYRRHCRVLTEDGECVIDRREARRRSRVEVVEVRKRVPLRYVPGHYEKLDAHRRHHGRWLPHHRWGKHGTVGPRCYPVMRVVGWQNNSRSGAEAYMERMWFFAIQNDYGGQYANWDRAENRRIDCNPSAITQYIKKVLWTCVAIGNPCRSDHGGVQIENERKRFDKDDVEVKD